MAIWVMSANLSQVSSLLGRPREAFLYGSCENLAGGAKTVSSPPMLDSVIQTAHIQDGWLLPKTWEPRTVTSETCCVVPNPFYSAVLQKSQVALPDDTLLQVMAVLKSLYMKPYSFMVLRKLP